ncbi:MAG: hypothetical protein AB1400_07920 [Pseudomonadota bacterium]
MRALNLKQFIGAGLVIGAAWSGEVLAGDVGGNLDLGDKGHSCLINGQYNLSGRVVSGGGFDAWPEAFFEYFMRFKNVATQPVRRIGVALAFNQAASSVDIGVVSDSGDIYPYGSIVGVHCHPDGIVTEVQSSGYTDGSSSQSKHKYKLSKEGNRLLVDYEFDVTVSSFFIFKHRNRGWVRLQFEKLSK